MITEVLPPASETVTQRIRRTFRTAFAVTAVALVGAVLFVGPAQPAAAAGSPQISVSPSSGLDPAGDYVMVSGSGFKPNIQLFVMQCRNNSGEDHTCNSVGLQKVGTDGSGSFSTRRPVQVSGNMGATDCTVTPCAVKTSAVSGHSADRSQDVLASISFGAPAAPVAPAPTTPPAPQPPVTEPPATAPPTTEAPTTTTTTTEAPATTTTTTEAPATTTTTEAPATTTSTTSVGKVTELAGGTDTSSGSGSSSSSPVPWIVGIVAGFVVVLGAVGGGIYTIRSRATR